VTLAGGYARAAAATATNIATARTPIFPRIISP
jgi:hypothetical protein